MFGEGAMMPETQSMALIVVLARTKNIQYQRSACLPLPSGEHVQEQYGPGLSSSKMNSRDVMWWQPPMSDTSTPIAGLSAQMAGLFIGSLIGMHDRGPPIVNSTSLNAWTI